MVRSTILNSYEDYEQAVKLASEAKRLRPASASATIQKATALAFLGNSMAVDDPQDALQRYRLVLDEFDELRRRDPTNRLWERERAAVQLLIAEGIVTCRQSKAKNCTPSPAYDEADAKSLESIGTLRALTVIDPENKSLIHDLAWALQVRAKVLAVQTGSAKSLEILQESEQLFSTLKNSSDTEVALQLGTILLGQSKALADLDRWAEAKVTLRRSINSFESAGKKDGAKEGNLAIAGHLMEARTEEVKLLRKTGDKKGADLADQERKRLEAQDINLDNSSEEEAEKLNASYIQSKDQGEKLSNEGKHDVALHEFNVAESSMRAYIGLKPSALVGYVNLRNIYDSILVTQEKLEDKLKDKKAREAALIAQLRAAQMAALFKSDDNKNLHTARRQLGILLNDNN